MTSTTETLFARVTAANAAGDVRVKPSRREDTSGVAGRQVLGSIHSSRRVVVIALSGAVLQTVALAIAAYMTSSAAMSAQTAANCADVAVQLFLLVGVLSSVRDPDGSHPIGYGRERYVWSLFAAIGIFLGGVFVAFEEALNASAHSTPVGAYKFGYAVLAITFLLDMITFGAGFKSLARDAAARSRSIHRELLHTTDPAAATVVYGGGVQLLGGVLAMGGLAFEQVTHSTTADAAASALIGVLLIGASVLLVNANRTLLSGRGVSPSVTRAMRDVVARQSGVETVPDLFAIVVGPESLIVDGDVTLADALDVPAAEETIARASSALREQWPSIAYVYLTPVASARPRRSNRVASNG